MLQALNILENVDLKAMGYNSARYMHTVYQAMNLAFADRDFYYGDPAFPPEEPIAGTAVEGVREGARRDDRGTTATTRTAGPGDPYPFQGGANPFARPARPTRSAAAPAARHPAGRTASRVRGSVAGSAAADEEAFYRRHRPRSRRPTTKGWVVSVTPSGGWIPAVIAGNTGIGLSQRMQSFVLDPADSPVQRDRARQAAARRR